MRLLILVVAIGAMAVFFWQNQQPIALVFFGGIWSLQLPLAAWVLLFAAAGALSSLVLRGLNSLGRKRPTTRDFSPPPRPRRPPQPPLRSEPTSNVPPSVPPASTSDWQASPPSEPETWDDWTVEASRPPVAQQPPEPATTESQLRNFEVAQQPQNISREGSIYSYRYREPRDRPQEAPKIEEVVDYRQPRDRPREVPKIGEVVDANYRVIVPPYQSPSQSSLDAEDDEDWLE